MAPIGLRERVHIALQTRVQRIVRRRTPAPARWRADPDSNTRSAAADRIGSGGPRRRWCWASNRGRSRRSSRTGHSRSSGRGSTCCRYSSPRARSPPASSARPSARCAHTPAPNHSARSCSLNASCASRIDCARSSGKSRRIVKSISCAQKRHVATRRRKLEIAEADERRAQLGRRSRPARIWDDRHRTCRARPLPRSPPGQSARVVGTPR